MDDKEEYFRWRTAGTNRAEGSSYPAHLEGSSHPAHLLTGSYVTLYYCYYEPKSLLLT